MMAGKTAQFRLTRFFNLQTPYGPFLGSVGKPNTSGLGDAAKADLAAATKDFKDTLAACLLNP